ncbi:MAG: LacI family DNA-binding transcriptional regulator [Lachnospiraceae bacterium]|nr:LacI family DNA-binding transcriptional regulator [Lachnospiraceae bacterium]
MSKRVTMSDIGKELNLSTVSVSKALNGKEGVSEQVREQIIKKAIELGYAYPKNSGEEGVKPHNIGIIISEYFISKDAYYSRLYEKTMMKLADEKQIGLLEIIKKSAMESLEAPALIMSHQIEGLIVLGQMSKKYLDMLNSYDLPVLYLDFYDEDIREDSVISDSIFGSGLLTNYLIHKGHRDIAFVGSIHSTSSIIDRYMGYLRALYLADIPVKEEWRLEDRDENGVRIEVSLPKNMPTAFVCNSDATAFELVKKLQREGYRVPEDISIVSFDNFIYSEMSTPKITTYGVDTDAMVLNAVRIILRKLDDRSYSVGRMLIPGTMIERQSVKDISG